MQNSTRKNILIISLLSAVLAMAAFLYASAETIIPNATGKVNGKSIVLRKSASNSGKSVAKLKNNAKLTIKKIVFTSKTNTSAKYKWYYANSSNKTGYIRSDYVDTLKFTKLSGKTSDNLNYRKGAGTGMKKISTFKKGKAIDIVLVANAKSDSSKWYQVDKNGKYYYVSADYVEFGDEPESEEEKEQEEEEKLPEKPVFTKSDVIYPSSILVGNSFNVGGIVTCDRNISKVEFGITDSDGDWIQVCNLNVNSKTFNISKVDNNIYFGRMIHGTYKYVGRFYVDGKWYKKINREFKVVAGTRNLTDEIVTERIQQMKDNLADTYFTTNKKACLVNDAEACDVRKVITQNSKVKNLIKENKGEGKLDTSLFPYHYNPTGVPMILGWSCCGFASFAGWYVGADDINSNVDYVMVKRGCKYDYETFKKYARIGDLIRTATHSFMVISVGDEGCEVIDSNWGLTCNCSIHIIKWTMYDTVTISRATTRK